MRVDYVKDRGTSLDFFKRTLTLNEDENTYKDESSLSVYLEETALN